MNQRYDQEQEARSKKKFFVLMALWPFTIWMPFLWKEPKPKTKEEKERARNFQSGCLTVFVILFLLGLCSM